MARIQGTLKLSSNIEPRVGAPLDARLVVDTKSELTREGNFTYCYVGMIVSVKDESKIYILKAKPATEAANWGLVSGPSDASVQVTELPEASETELGNIYQYVGETDSSYINAYFYKCVTVAGSDPTEYKWQAVKVQAGGAGSASLENELVVTAPYDGVYGTVYPEGTDLETIFRDLLNPVTYPTLTAPSAALSTLDAKLIEKGSTLTTTLIAGFNRGSINPANGTDGYRSGSATSYSLNGDTPQLTNEFSNITVDEEHVSYVVTVVYEAGEQPKDSRGNNYGEALASGSVNSPALTFEFVDAWWMNGRVATTIEKQALVSKTGDKTRTLEFPATTESNPEVFDVPASWTVTSIEVFNDLTNKWQNCASEFTKTTTTHNNTAGDTVDYSRYTCNLPYEMAARNIRVKWS